MKWKGDWLTTIKKVKGLKAFNPQIVEELIDIIKIYEGNEGLSVEIRFKYQEEFKQHMKILKEMEVEHHE